MRIYEHEAKRVFEAEGLVVPKPIGVFRDAAELAETTFEGTVVVKAQVLIGGRGKAGGVKLCHSTEEMREAASRIIGMDIKGYRVDAVLVEAAVPHSAACYVGITVNPATANNIVMASASGGVEIETIAVERPEAILRRELPDNPDLLPDDVAAEFGAFLAHDLGADQVMAAALADAVARLYAIYQKFDCKVVEINPLLITDTGPVAADGKMVVDDNAFFRQGDLMRKLGIQGKRHEVSEPTARERRAAAAGFVYVDLLPENAPRDPSRVYVGLVPGGAGYGIFSIDEVTNVGDRFFDGKVVPLNFMDSGGGPSVKAVVDMFDLLMDHPLVDLIVTSRFGGISSCDIFIRGVLECVRKRHASGRRMIPIYGRMVGTDLAAARAALDKARSETPIPLKDLHMVVGNQMIMAEVIRQGLQDFVQKSGQKNGKEVA